MPWRAAAATPKSRRSGCSYAVRRAAARRTWPRRSPTARSSSARRCSSPSSPTEPHGWLLLQGAVGCGKTHLAAAIKNERDRNGLQTLFKTTPDLLDYLRATYAPDSNVTYDRGFDAIRNAEVLILDDYGAHSSTPWAEEKLFQLLNYRFNARLPTVITTNQPLDRSALSLGAPNQELRILSRLIDPDLCTSCYIDALPYRRPRLAS